MKTTLRSIVAIAWAALCAATANATPFSVAASQMGAIYNSGTIPIGTPAISLYTPSATFVNLNPTVDYSYLMDSSANPLAGLTPDYHFLGASGTTPGSTTSPIWTFASLASDYYLYPTTDHTPLPQEALESSLYGSNNGGSTWILGTVAEVYEQGWDPSGIPDDGATRWKFSTPVNMISAVVGLTQNPVGLPGYSYSDGDFETDAVMQVTPEPATGSLLFIGAGVIGLTWGRRSARLRPAHNGGR